MGYTLRFTLGWVLVFALCIPIRSSTLRHVRQTVEEIPTKNLTHPQDVASENSKEKFDSTELATKLKINSDATNQNEDESKPKTDIENKNVNTNKLLDRENNIPVDKLDSKNLTSIKLESSEPYKPEEKKLDFKNDLKKETQNKKDNVIKESNNEPLREDNARSINVDVDKYVSPEFHDRNNVYTVPSSPETEKYYLNEYEPHTSTQNHDSSKFKFTPNSELTTPKIDFFDNRYKEAVESVDQKLEHSEFKDSSQESKEDFDIDKFIDQTKNPEVNTNLDYVKFKNIVNDDKKDKNSLHKDLVVEEGTNLNFQSNFNTTTSYNNHTPEHHVESVEESNESESKHKEQKGDLEQVEVTTPKNNFIATTRKNVILTKPPSVKNNSHIRSNKIETETIKAINVKSNAATTPSSLANDTAKGETEELPPRTSTQINVTKRGSVKYADYTTPAQPTISTRLKKVDEVGNKSLEQTVQENQILPVHVEAPDHITKTVTTTTEMYPTTVTEDVPQTISNVLITEVPEISQRIATEVREETTTVIEEKRTTTEVPTTTTINEDDLTTITPSTTTTQPTTTTTTTTSTTETVTSSTLPDIDNETTLVDITSTTESTTIDLNITQNDSENITTTNVELTTLPESETTENVDYSTTTVPSISVETNNSIDKTRNMYQTTESDIRTSKRIIFSETTTQNMMDETTTPISITTTVTVPEITTTEISESTKNVSRNGNNTLEKMTEQDSTTLASRITSETPAVTEILMKINETTVESTSFEFVEVTTVPVIVTTIRNKDEDEGVTQFRNIPPNKTTDETTMVVPKDEVPTEDPLVDDPEDNGGTIAAIIISSIAAVCAVLLVGLLYVMRKRQRRNNNRQLCKPVSLDEYSMDNGSRVSFQRRRNKGALDASKRSYGNPAFDDPAAPTHPLNIQALPKFSNNLDDIKAEFQDIPQITAWTNELPEGCETKNRYANVIPLPETRVHLTENDSTNSDYINANYVTGPGDTKKYYIASQAPMQNTVDDFWRMIWEQQCKVILMLTHLFENGTEKSVDYLPPSEVLDCHRTFGDFRVTLKKREVKEKYIISSLQLNNMVSNSWREVTHFYYLGWPEKGVPSEANSIIAFLIEARSFMKTCTLDSRAAANGNTSSTSMNEINPVVVHCSPGTGRTGVVIACDIAIREFEKSRLVDIPRIVYRIRRDRARAVETLEQYQFIYKVVSLYATKLTGGALDSL